LSQNHFFGKHTAFFRYKLGRCEFIAFSIPQSNQSPAREPSKSASLVQKSAKTTTSQLLIAAAHFYCPNHIPAAEYANCKRDCYRDRKCALIPGGCCLIAVLNMTLKLIWDEPDRLSA